MTEKPMSKFWQIHLSTAIILVLEAGALLGIAVDVYSYTEPHFSAQHVAQILGLSTQQAEEWDAQTSQARRVKKMTEIAKVLCMGALLLTFTAVVSEWLIRHGKART